MKKSIDFYQGTNFKNFKELLNVSCKKFKNNPVFYEKYNGNKEFTEITYEKFGNDINCLGEKLIEMGLKDKYIAVIGENSYNWAVTYFAVVTGVGVIVPIDKELPENEIINILKRSNAEAIIFSDKKKEIFENIKLNSEINVKHFINMKEEFPQILQQGDLLIKSNSNQFAMNEKDPNKISILLFTSGTTSEAKAVMLSQTNILYDVYGMSKTCDADINDKFFSVLPLHHTYEASVGMVFPIACGSSIAICQGLRYIADNLVEAKPTIMLGVPLLYENIYNKIWDKINKSGKANLVKSLIKFSNIMKKFNIDVTKILFKQMHEVYGGKLRILASGAAAMNEKIERGYENFGFVVVQGYGLTETAPIIIINSSNLRKIGSAGIPLPGVEIKIDKPDKDGIGEIIAKGPNVMLGYLNNEEATNKVFDNEGYFHTDDLGYMDSDGFVFITGRQKSMIVTKNGKKIFPEEIEPMLNKFEYIKESLVYGEDDGEDVVVKAIIVPNYEFIKNTHGENLPEEKLKQMLKDYIKTVNKQLVNYKHIRDFKIQNEEFIKTTTMKIKRHMVNK